MKEKDYPALYQVANHASVKAQREFLRLTVAQSLLLIVGTSLSFFGIESQLAQVVAAALLIISLLASVLVAYMKYERVWYKGRVITESIKTMTWKYMMRAEPFSGKGNSAADETLFRERLNAVLREIPVLGMYLAHETASKDQITNEMKAVRMLSLKERASFYLAYRIKEQKEWYASKAVVNLRNNRRFFWGLIFFQFLAIIFLICRVAEPGFKYWPTEICVVVASSLLAWIQIKRFEEHATAYSLAANEIGLIEVSINGIVKDAVFSEFVNDSENAFSREHTQWVARRNA